MIYRNASVLCQSECACIYQTVNLVVFFTKIMKIHTQKGEHSHKCIELSPKWRVNSQCMTYKYMCFMFFLGFSACPTHGMTCSCYTSCSCSSTWSCGSACFMPVQQILATCRAIYQSMTWQSNRYILTTKLNALLIHFIHLLFF